MRRNSWIALVAAVAATGVAAAAAAQQSMGADQVSRALPPPPAADFGVFADPATPGESQANLQQSYDLSIMMLKKKMERLTREDGGELSVPHQLSLQKELDEVNRRYHAGRFAQR